MNKTKFADMNKKEQLKARKTAFRTWALAYEQAYNKKQPLQAAATNAGMTLEEVNYYFKKDKWLDRLEKIQMDGTLERIIAKNKKKAFEHINENETVNKINKLLDDAKIPDRWKMFILYYLQSFNATVSARKAGYTNHAANVQGSQILNHPKVKSTLEEVKRLMQEDIYITGRDLLNQYVKIAFADMTEFVEFDARRVKLKNSSDVDGRLITEVKQGKDGVTIKLADKMKAMEKLEKLFDIIPDKRLELDMAKFELNKRVIEKQLQETGEGASKVVIINDL
jgi:phage terminase small subunit